MRNYYVCVYTVFASIIFEKVVGKKNNLQGRLNGVSKFPAQFPLSILMSYQVCMK